MKFNDTKIKDCKIIEVDQYCDNRGFFEELYSIDKYSNLENHYWQQTNFSFSEKDVLRGIHLANYAKLVTCLSGNVIDLVIDFRENSKTYLEYIFIDLDSPNKQVYVPAGCGHGFLAKEKSLVVYMQTGQYKDGERTIKYDDPYLNIDWPKKEYILSERDKNALCWGK